MVTEVIIAPTEVQNGPAHRPNRNHPKGLESGLCKIGPPRMPLRIVQSKQNPRLKELRRSLAYGRREAGAPVGIEGPNLLEEVLRAGIGIQCVFAAQGAERLLDGLKLSPEAEVLLLPKDVLASALATETPQLVAALINPPEWSWADVLGDCRGQEALIVVLAGLQDPGNLGTILRSAEAFGATGVIALQGTVSEWNPKAVRASAGSIFRLPVITAEVEECFGRLRAAGVGSLTTAGSATTAAGEADMSGPVALIIGNEGNGVPAQVAAQADGAIAIPCPGPVESLNAAVAASVLLYEASRQRAALRIKGSNRRREIQ